MGKNKVLNSQRYFVYVQDDHQTVILDFNIFKNYENITHKVG